ncbi:MAG TPA: hypothetical protein VMU01_11165 [Rhizomicrobium sp.]|nr:hypothetical protein [Rhizomicrobium sp.]
MRLLLIAAGFALSTCAASAEDWIAVCFGQDTQYTQTINGPGYFHVANGNGTYDTQKLVNSYHDGNMVCGTVDPKAPKALSEIAEVCADKANKYISVMTLADDVGKKITPQNSHVYCQARVSVY